MIEYNMMVKDSNASFSKKDIIYDEILTEQYKEFFKLLESQLKESYYRDRGQGEEGDPDTVLKIKIVL